MRIAIVTVWASLLLSACVSSGTKVDENAAAHFEKGVSTQTDVERALGAPQSRSTSPDGTHSIGYVYMHGHAKAATFIPIVGLFAGGGVGQSVVVTFRFDSNGKLLDYASSQTNVDTKNGLAAGPAQ